MIQQSHFKAHIHRSKKLIQEDTLFFNVHSSAHNYTVAKTGEQLDVHQQGVDKRRCDILYIQRDATQPQKRTKLYYLQQHE